MGCLVKMEVLNGVDVLLCKRLRDDMKLYTPKSVNHNHKSVKHN